MSDSSFKLMGPGVTRLLLQGPHADPDGRLWTESTAAQQRSALEARGRPLRRTTSGPRKDRGEGGVNEGGPEGSGDDLGDDDDSTGGLRAAKGRRALKPRIFW